MPNQEDVQDSLEGLDMDNTKDEIVATAEEFGVNFSESDTKSEILDDIDLHLNPEDTEPDVGSESDDEPAPDVAEEEEETPTDRLEDGQPPQTEDPSMEQAENIPSDEDNRPDSEDDNSARGEEPAGGESAEHEADTSGSPTEKRNYQRGSRRVTRSSRLPGN